MANAIDLNGPKFAAHGISCSRAWRSSLSQIASAQRIAFSLCHKPSLPRCVGLFALLCCTQVMRSWGADAVLSGVRGRPNAPLVPFSFRRLGAAADAIAVLGPPTLSTHMLKHFSCSLTMFMLL